MNRFSLGRLFALWSALMLSLPIGMLWLSADVPEGHRLPAGIKLAVLLAGTCAGAIAVAVSTLRRWASLLVQFNRFAAVFPAQETELPIDGPPELEGAARAMQGMAQRVRSIVEQ